MTQEEALEWFEYRDGNLYWKKTSNGRAQEGKLIDTTSRGYKVVRLKGKIYRVHRVIFLMFHGYMPDLIDHRNQNRGDNRIENLRPASKRENAINTKKRAYCNVFPENGSPKFRVQLTVNGKCKRLGTYWEPMLGALSANFFKARNCSGFNSNFEVFYEPSALSFSLLRRNGDSMPVR